MLAQRIPARRHAGSARRSRSMGGAGWRSTPPGAAAGYARNPNRTGEANPCLLEPFRVNRGTRRPKSAVPISNANGSSLASISPAFSTTRSTVGADDLHTPHPVPHTVTFFADQQVESTCDTKSLTF
jgi:hypothetical protein